MRLVKIENHYARRLELKCRCCGQAGRIDDMMADLDGPAFNAYYCNRCISLATSCGTDGKITYPGLEEK